jgi:hypothetical protein
MQFNRKFEIGAWIAYILIANTVGATSVMMEHARDGEHLSFWEPLTWEYTSGVITLLLIPLIIMLDRRMPLRAGSWKRAVAVHAVATLPFSLLHIGGMVALRKVIYALGGSRYDFGNVPVELLYEYRKDFLTYFFIIAAIYAYRMFRANHTGAHYLAAEENRRAMKFLVKKRGQVYNISPDSVDWVEAAGNYVILHVGESSHPLRDTMQGIAERLGDAFCRVHRSTIVNLTRVTSTSPAQGGDLVIHLQDGTHLRCSRTMRGNFEAMLGARAA